MDSAVPVLSGGAPFKLYLHPVKNGRVYNGFMIALHIVLRNLTFIDFCFLCEVVHSVGFLQKGIALVLLVGENPLDRCYLLVTVTLARATSARRGEPLCRWAVLRRTQGKLFSYRWLSIPNLQRPRRSSRGSSRQNSSHRIFETLTSPHPLRMSRIPRWQHFRY